MLKKRMRQIVENKKACPPNNRRGFTLVENMMYVAFVAILASVFVGFGTRISDIREKARVLQLGIDTERIVLDLISTKVKSSDQILSPVRGATSSELIMDMPSTDDDLRFFVQDGVLFCDENDEIVQISSDALNFEAVEFMNVVDSVYGKDSIKVDIKVKGRHQESVAYKYDNEYQIVVGIRR